MLKLRLLPALVAILACGLAHAATPTKAAEFVGTDEPFASNAIYFVMTDRFVNGGPSNDQRNQGGAHHTFDIRVPGPNGDSANIGYLGGDFKSALSNASYIHVAAGFRLWYVRIQRPSDKRATSDVA
jgi:hypothetical protein